MPSAHLSPRPDAWDADLDSAPIPQTSVLNTLNRDKWGAVLNISKKRRTMQILSRSLPRMDIDPLNHCIALCKARV